MPAVVVTGRADRQEHARGAAGSFERWRWRARTCCLPLLEQRRHPGYQLYRGSMAGLCVPLPTLRRHPRGCLRTARGRCGSLYLHRSGLAPLTPCRSPGALKSVDRSRVDAREFEKQRVELRRAAGRGCFGSQEEFALFVFNGVNESASTDSVADTRHAWTAMESGEPDAAYRSRV